MIDHVAKIKDEGKRVPAKLKTALNKFFNEVDCAEGCLLKVSDGIELIIEESYLYSYLTGEYGWSIHTKFYNAFDGCGYHPEMINSCVVGFYKD